MRAGVGGSGGGLTGACQIPATTSSWRDTYTIGGRIYELEERGLPATLGQLTQWLTPAQP
jgi:hypothetical protein